MEGADDINRVVDDIDINAMDNNMNNSGDTPEASGAIGGTAPEQLTRAQLATENELKRLGSRLPPGRKEELEFPQDRRRRESNLIVSKTQHDILSQQFG